MTEPVDDPRRPTDVTPTTPSTRGHHDHDGLLIAAHAAGDLVGSARTEAEARIADCPDCAVLYADLVAISAATRALPPPARPRSFTLSPADAARLRPSAWQRLAAAFGAPGGAMRPMAATFTTLGIAGLLVVGLSSLGPIGLGGSAASAPQHELASQPSAASSAAASSRDDLYAQNAGGPTTEPAPRAPDAGGIAAPSGGTGSTGTTSDGGPVALPSPAASGGTSKGDQNAPGQAPSAAGQASPAAAQASPAAGQDGRTSAAASQGAQDLSTEAAPVAGQQDGRPWLLVLSLALLGIGLGLFAARRIGRPD